ncbi:hypothetical protein H4I96_12066 [Botrytis cinerea]
MELSRFCIAAWSLIEAAQRKYPKQSMKSFTCIIGQFLPQFFFPFDTVEDLMIAISFLVQKGLEEDCVADMFNFTPSPVLPSPPPPSATLQSPALRKAALRSPALQKTALRSPALRKAALRSPPPQSSTLQSPALQKTALRSATLRSPPAPSPASPSQPCYKPTHYTSTSVPLTNDTDNSKGFLERYQVFFENKSLVPLDYNKYPGLNQAYHKGSKLNFIYDTSVNHCNSSMFYRSRSRLMVVLPPEIQTLIGIFPLIEESKEAITLDRFAFLTVCNRKCISVESLRQSTKAKVLRDVIKATLESFYDQQVIFEDNVSSPELVLIWITNFWGKSNTLIQRTINGVHNTCCTGNLTGIWIGQDGLIFLDIRGDFGPWMRWLNVFDYNFEWNLKTAS